MTVSMTGAGPVGAESQLWITDGIVADGINHLDWVDVRRMCIEDLRGDSRVYRRIRILLRCRSWHFV